MAEILPTAAVVGRGASVSIRQRAAGLVAAYAKPTPRVPA
jgi:hypothetical protein